MTGWTRPPAVAGRFYPADPDRLRATVRGFLAAAHPGPPNGPPKALVVPHAGYPFSGPIAGTAYATSLPWRGAIRRVVLLGTAHTGVAGLAACTADAFATPLGDVPVDRPALDSLADLPQVHDADRAHLADHALEVQLPFLQEVLDRFAIVPLLVGRADPEAVAEVLDRLWGGPETLIVVSTDLSHYQTHAEAQALDRAAADAITALDPAALADCHACGHHALRGLLVAARRHGLVATTADLRTSGDTAGPRDSVVGYGAFVLTPEPALSAS